MAAEGDVKRFIQYYLDVTESIRRANILNDDNTRRFVALRHLLVFEKKNGRQMTISDLSEITGMALSNVSRFLRPLEEKGYVARRREGRNVYLSITADGEKFFAEKEGEVVDLVGKMLSVLTDGELKAHLQISEKISASLNT